MSGENKVKDLYLTERKLINSSLEMAKIKKQWEKQFQSCMMKLRNKKYIDMKQLLLLQECIQVQLTQSKQQQISAQEELIYGLINQLEAELVISSFEVDNFLGPELVKNINKMMCRQNLNVALLQQFPSKYPDNFIKLGSVQENYSLIRLKIKDAQVDCGNVLKTWKPCYIIATIDGNILIYLREYKINSKGNLYVQTQLQFKKQECH